jgi:predicted DsbA family dithiol-disulfide isomerase
MSDPLSLVIYSDVICPWCYVGKRRLEAALDDPGVPQPAGFAWRPFELNPDMPAEGVERHVYRASKFGAARSAELDRNMLATGREVGIAFAFDRMQRTPNTRLAHRLIWEAGRQGRQDPFVERLFHGYFEEALDIGDADVLKQLAAESGLEADAVKAALTESDSLDAVTGLEQEGYRLGIQGVPFFIVAQKYAVSGAQPPDFWRDALPRIAAEAVRPSPDAPTE